MDIDNSSSKRKFWLRALQTIERVGNRFPHPATIFASLAVATIFISALVAHFDISVIHPVTKETIRPISLLNIAGFQKILTSLATNLTEFTPLSTVLVALLGISVAEGSGLVAAAMKYLVTSVPKRILTAAIIFLGIVSHSFGDVGFLLLVPLAPVIYLAVGRHPLAGLAAANAAVGGALCANVLLGVVDPLLAGITQQAAHQVDPNHTVNLTCNYYFMFVCAIMLTVAGTVVTEKIVAPRLGAYENSELPNKIDSITLEERRGLRFTLIAGVICGSIILVGLLPANGFLRDPKTHGILQSPFITGIIAILFLGGLILGLAYGFGSRTIRRDSDVINSMSKSLEIVGLYLIVVFFAAQFLAFFTWTNLGLIIAVKGADLLQGLRLSGIPLIIGFIILVVLLDFLISSAFAKWTLIAPIFVPMFMLMGYSPELIQMAYRIADSFTNPVEPFLAFVPFILTIGQKYDKNFGIGTYIALMFPYFIVFSILCIGLLVIWILLGLNLGPEAGIYFQK